jgi:hypothetical protein
LDNSVGSIERVAEFDVEKVLNFQGTAGGRQDALEFERSVQAWLERLGTEAGLRELPAELRHAAQSYIVPAISQGNIRAGHPRMPVDA